MVWAASLSLLPIAYQIQFWCDGDQDILDGCVQDGAQGVQIVDSRQSFSLLPFVDRLRLLKAKVVLQIPDGQAPFQTEPQDVLSRGFHVDDRESAAFHENNLLMLDFRTERIFKNTGRKYIFQDYCTAFRELGRREEIFSCGSYRYASRANEHRESITARNGGRGTVCAQ